MVVVVVGNEIMRRRRREEERIIRRMVVGKDGRKNLNGKGLTVRKVCDVRERGKKEETAKPDKIQIIIIIFLINSYFI